MDKTKTSLITILAILIFGLPIVLGSSSNHILIIFSTSEDTFQAREINRGMKQYLDNHPDFASVVLVDHYYLNMDNPTRQKCEVYLTEIKKVQDIIEDNKPDLIILSGDIAQRLVGIRLITDQATDKNILKNNVDLLASEGKCTGSNLKNDLRDALQPIPVDSRPKFSFSGIRMEPYKPKIVFTGVTSQDVKEFGYQDQPELTGIYQHLYIPAIKETIADIYNNIPKEPDGKPSSIIIIYDDASSKAPKDIQDLKTELSRKNAFGAPIQWGGFFGVTSWDKWQETIRSANKNKAMVFVAGYDNVGEQPARSVIRWTEGCATFPVIGGTESFVDDGGMLTVTISNQEQGSSALDLANQLLTTSPTENIPFQHPNQFTIITNQSLLEKRNLQLPAIYESFSRLNNTFQDIDYLYSNPAGCSQ